MCSRTRIGISFVKISRLMLMTFEPENIQQIKINSTKVKKYLKYIYKIL